MKKLLAGMVFSVFLGTQILALNIGIKLSIYRILFLIVVSLFLMMVANNDARLRFYPNKLSHSFSLFYGLWFLYSLLSLIWVENIAGWAKANVFIGIGVVSIFFIQLFMTKKRDVLTLIKAIVLGTTLHIAIGLGELVTGKYAWASEHFMTKYRPASRGFFTRIPISIYPNENDYATVLLMGSFFILMLFNNAKAVYWKVFYGLLWLSSVFLINQTDSRANVVALIIGFLAMLLVYVLPLITKRMVTYTGILGLGMVSVLLIVSSTVRGQLDFLRDLFSTSTEFGGTSNEIRVNLIRNGFRFLKESFGFGVGAGNIEYLMKHEPPYQTGGISNMHNWWMEILTSYGVFVFAAYLLIYVALILRAYNYYKTSQERFVRQTALLIIGYLAAFILSSISSANNIINEWQWLIFGVIIAFYSYCEQREINVEPQVKNLEH